MYNTPGLIQAKSFTVNPTTYVGQTLSQHSAESDKIDAEFAHNALKPTGYGARGFANRARQRINTVRGNEWSEFAVY